MLFDTVFTLLAALFLLVLTGALDSSLVSFSSASLFLNKNIPVSTSAKEKTSIEVIVSARKIPENNTPKTDVVE